GGGGGGPLQGPDAGLVVLLDAGGRLVGELAGVEAAALVEELALLVHAVALGVADPLGERGGAGPESGRDFGAGLQQGDEALDAAVGAALAGVLLELLLLGRGGEAPGAAVSLEEVVGEPVD